jgi:hypothetical protein
MASKARRAAFALATLLLLVGCAGKGNVRGERSAPTRIAPEEGVVLLQGRLPFPDPGSDTEAHERSLGDWLLGAMREESPGMRIVPPEEFRRVAFPGRSFSDSPRTGEEILAFLGDEEASEDQCADEPKAAFDELEKHHPNGALSHSALQVIGHADAPILCYRKSLGKPSRSRGKESPKGCLSLARDFEPNTAGKHHRPTV